MNYDRSAEKAEAEQDGKKKKGGISIPENWPWEEAKKIFEKPDVTPADDVEVSRIVSSKLVVRNSANKELSRTSWNGQIQTSRV